MRSVGLWLYKRDSNEIVSEQVSSADATRDNENSNFIFANTEPYSDEIVVQNVMSKLVASIESEQQSDLLTSEGGSIAGQESRDIVYPIKKRKLNEMEAIASSSPLKKVAKNESGFVSTSFDKSQSNKSKAFDPVAEHFHWCPWTCKYRNEDLNDEPKNISLSQESADPYLTFENMTMCHANMHLLRKFLTRKNTPIVKNQLNKSINVSITSILNNSLKSSEELSKEADSLSERVKSIKSLLINCTTQFSN